MTTTTDTERERPTKKLPGLRANALGLPALFAQSMAVISPTMTAVLIIPLAFASAGQGTWLAYAFGTVMLLFVVFCLNQFARRSASAGSMYAYTARGLGPSMGVFSGWTLIWAYLFIAVAGLCGFAVFCQQLIAALGFHVTVHPIVFFAVSAVLCWLVAYKDIRVSSLLTLALEFLSVTCILALAFVVLFKHGFSVDTTQLKLHGVAVRGMGLAIVACIFSLVGFESATALGGEAKNPQAQRPQGGDRQPDLHRTVHGLHGLRGSGRHPRLPHPVHTDRGAPERPGRPLRRAGLQDPHLHRGHDQLLLAVAVVPQRRGPHHLPDGPTRDLHRAPGPGPRQQPHPPHRRHRVHRHRSSASRWCCRSSPTR